MDNEIGCFALAVFGVVAFAAWRLISKHNERWAAEMEKEKADAEEKFRPYPEAWAAARASNNLDAFIQCGDYLIKAARLWQPHLLGTVSWDVYQEILLRLKENPALKPLALEKGRVAYSARRPDRALTLYDEQAIQNDIIAHS